MTSRRVPWLVKTVGTSAVARPQTLSSHLFLRLRNDRNVFIRVVAARRRKILDKKVVVTFSGAQLQLQRGSRDQKTQAAHASHRQFLFNGKPLYQLLKFPHTEDDTMALQTAGEHAATTVLPDIVNKADSLIESSNFGETVSEHLTALIRQEAPKSDDDCIKVFNVAWRQHVQTYGIVIRAALGKTGAMAESKKGKEPKTASDDDRLKELAAQLNLEADVDTSSEIDQRAAVLAAYGLDLPATAKNVQDEAKLIMATTLEELREAD